MEKPKDKVIEDLKIVKEKEVSNDIKKEIDKKIANTIKPFNK